MPQPILKKSIDLRTRKVIAAERGRPLGEVKISTNLRKDLNYTDVSIMRLSDDLYREFKAYNPKIYPSRLKRAVTVEGVAGVVHRAIPENLRAD